MLRAIFILILTGFFSTALKAKEIPIIVISAGKSVLIDIIKYLNIMNL